MRVRVVVAALFTIALATCESLTTPSVRTQYPGFAIGDTVSNRTLSPVGAVDILTAHADSGEDFVAVAESPTVWGLGPIGLTVWDPQGGTVAQAVFPTGAPARITTGRMHAHSAGDYRFAFAGIPQTLNGVQEPLFHGPYRFWTYAIDPAPEQAVDGLTPGAVVTNESIDPTGDVDVFTFPAAAGSQVNVFYQSAIASHLEIGPNGGTALGTLAAASDTGLYSNFTGDLNLPATGTYSVRVLGDGAAIADTGRYRLLVYPINRQPETVPPTITPGDTVTGEAIDLPGDIDEFPFTALGGRDYYAFLQAQSGSAATILELDVVDSTGAVLGSVQSHGADTSLTSQGSDRISVATTRTLRLRVSGAGASVGPYRLLLYLVNPKPESVPDTIIFGDSVVGESIDFRGDVDVFRVHVTDSSEVSLVWQSSVSLAVADSATGTFAALDGDYPDPYSAATLRLSRGTYLVRVAGTVGPYRLWLFRFKLGPEAVGDTVSVGDTVRGEAIDVPGDIDTYHFYGSAGNHINIMLQSLPTAAGGTPVVAYLTGPAEPFVLAEIGALTTGGALSDHQLVRMDLQWTGWYTLAVSVPNGTPPLAAVGPYVLAVVPVSTAPEVVGATLAIGDSVTTEPLSPAGDWDQFTVSGTPGSELNVLFGSDSSGVPPHAAIIDPSTGATLAGADGGGFSVAGPATFPASGQLAIAVYESARAMYPWGCFGPVCAYSFTGPYVLQPLLLNRAPESASATYVLGDTVTTEAVSPAGDLDEFTLTAAPGDTLSAWWRLRADPAPAGTLITLEVFDAATGTVLEGGMGVPVSQPQFVTQGPFVVPASGRLLIRFRATTAFGEPGGTGPYAFFVKRGG